MNDKSVIHDNRAPLSEHRIRGRGRRALWAIVLIGAAAALASYVAGCSEYPRHQRGIFAEHGPRGIQEKVERALTQVDATDEQRQKVAAALKDLDSDATRWQEDRKVLRDRMMQALLAEQVDRNDLATIKSAGLSLADQALSRTVDTTLKLSEVLTAKQRKELVAQWKSDQ